MARKACERADTERGKPGCSVMPMIAITHTDLSNTANTAAAHDGGRLSDLSDGELLANTRMLVGRSNQLLAALLLHLGEVEARGLHRTRACASLYSYCIFELRLSEDEACRRVAAARLVHRLPALVDAIARGELHLTGLLLLGPHLTPENAGEVLVRARYRTKKEIAKLVRELAPLPDVAARIEPLGPAPTGLVPRSPTWQEWAASLCPVRELAPGDRPADWVSDVMDGVNDTVCAAPEDLPAGSAPAPGTLAVEQPAAALARVENAELLDAPNAAVARAVPQHPAPPALARVEGAAPVAAQRYRVEFTASEEYVSLVEQARALLSHAVPNAPLEEIHLQALRLLVAELEKRKYAVTARPPKGARAADSERRAAGPERRKRYLPAAVRRAVFERDGGRCSYVDGRGERCRETHRLEFHHLQAFARGGEHTEANLTLRCAAHNALAAEEDFGRDFMANKSGQA
jgi:hypothetical protein